MRILITTDVFPPDAGGPATYVPVISEALVKLGHSVQVLTYSRQGPEVEDGQYLFHVRRIPLDQSRQRRLAEAGAALRRGLSWADLLYANGLLVEAALANIVYRRPVVAKVVGDIAWERARDKGWITDEFEEFQHKRYGWRIELRRAWRNWALRRARAVIVPSAYLKHVVVGWGIEAERVHVVYNAFEPADGDVPAVELPLDTHYRLITVGRLVAWKGIDELIETIAPMPDIGLVVVGDGPEGKNLEALAGQLGVRERVHFAGQVSREEVPAYLRACDLLVLNSRYEGLPHVVLEALAVGLPVVAAAAGGTPEILRGGEHGRLVPPGDTNELGNAIREVLEMPASRLALNLPEQFGCRRMIEDTVTVLHESIAQ
ncbi:MAG: glycosyltransferase family 4 protein [Anaerolineae bacterium]